MMLVVRNRLLFPVAAPWKNVIYGKSAASPKLKSNFYNMVPYGINAWMNA